MFCLSIAFYDNWQNYWAHYGSTWYVTSCPTVRKKTWSPFPSLSSTGVVIPFQNTPKTHRRGDFEKNSKLLAPGRRKEISSWNRADWSAWSVLLVHVAVICFHVKKKRTSKKMAGNLEISSKKEALPTCPIHSSSEKHACGLALCLSWLESNRLRYIYWKRTQLDLVSICWSKHDSRIIPLK